jgi:hypothetical protein
MTPNQLQPAARSNDGGSPRVGDATTRLVWPAIVLTGLCLGGCLNARVGGNPFQCAATGKPCPDGYTCTTSGAEKVCVPDGTKLDAQPRDVPLLTDAELAPSKERPFRLDGAKVLNPTNCMDSPNEPNNDLEHPTNMNAAGAGLVPGWELCYTGDIDVYKWSRNIGDRLVVEIKFIHLQGDLELALFSPDGNVISESRSEQNNEKVAMNTAPVGGDYLVAVWGFMDAVNSYDIVITK